MLTNLDKLLTGYVPFPSLAILTLDTTLNQKEKHYLSAIFDAP
jgi:hypothetical protein